MGCDLSVAVFRTSCIGMFCNGLPQVVYLSGCNRLAHIGAQHDRRRGATRLDR